MRSDVKHPVHLCIAEAGFCEDGSDSARCLMQNEISNCLAVALLFFFGGFWAGFWGLWLYGLCIGAEYILF